MYEPLQKSGHSPWRVQSLAGSNWPSDSRPVYVDQNWVERKSPPNVSAQQESTLRGFARLEQDSTESASAGESYQQHRSIVALAQATDSKRKCGWRCSRYREQRMPPLRRAKLQQLWNASRESTNASCVLIRAIRCRTHLLYTSIIFYFPPTMKPYCRCR